MYLLGSGPAPPPRPAGAKRWYPGLRRRGTHHGYFDLDSPHNERVIEDIDPAGRTSCSSGWARPKQELWVQRNAGPARRRRAVDRRRAVRLCLRPRAARPGWLADNGLEWIFRLAVEPQRMWRRYLLGNPVFLSRVMAETRRRARRADYSARERARCWLRGLVGVVRSR